MLSAPFLVAGCRHQCGATDWLPLRGVVRGHPSVLGDRFSQVPGTVPIRHSSPSTRRVRSDPSPRRGARAHQRPRARIAGMVSLSPCFVTGRGYQRGAVDRIALRGAVRAHTNVLGTHVARMRPYIHATLVVASSVLRRRCHAIAWHDAGFEVPGLTDMHTGLGIRRHHTRRAPSYQPVSPL